MIARGSVAVAVLAVLLWGFSCAQTDGTTKVIAWPATWDAETWILLVWLAIKYFWPKSRSAQNFWSGVSDLIRGDKKRAILNIVSSTGVTHTPPSKPPPKAHEAE